MNEPSSEIPIVVANTERRMVPYFGPIELEPEVIIVSDEDSDDAPEVVEELPRFDPLKLGSQPGSLLLYLRIKWDSFEKSIKSLGKSFEPLLSKYLAVLNQLEQETDFVNAGLRRLYDVVAIMLKEKRMSARSIEFLERRLSASEWLIDVYEKKALLESEVNK